MNESEVARIIEILFTVKTEVEFIKEDTKQIPDIKSMLTEHKIKIENAQQDIDRLGLKQNRHEENVRIHDFSNGSSRTGIWARFILWCAQNKHAISIVASSILAAVIARLHR